MIFLHFKIQSIFIGAILLLNSSVKAQENQDYVRNQPGNLTSVDKKISLSFSVGAAIPLLDFGSSNVQGSFWDQNSTDSTRLQGFAKTGFHFDIIGTYLVNNFWGISLLIGGNVNEFDINSLSSAIGYTSTSSTTTYYTGEYLIGPIFSLDISPTLKFRLSVLAGLAKNNYPAINIAYNDTIFFNITMNSGSLSFAYSAKTDLVYSINDYIDLLFSLSYTGVLINYQGYTETQQINSTHPTVYYFITQPAYHPYDKTYMNTGILKPCIGIAFKF